MSSRGQPAPSPPVQIAQQPRPNTAAARGQTPPTGYGQQEEYGQVYQQQQQQQQSLYQTPPGVPSQNYEISKQNFVVPSTQNQGGQAAQMAGMYPQNPSMRNNQPPFYSSRPPGQVRPNFSQSQQNQQNQNMSYQQPQLGYIFTNSPQFQQAQSQLFMPGGMEQVSRMQNPPYPNLTSQTQQSVMYPMPQAQHMQYNQQQCYNNPTIYYPNQNGQSNMHTPTTVPATREKKKLITIPDPNTKQDVTSKVHHLDEPAPATSDSRSSETPNSAVQEPSYSSRPPGQVRPNFSQSQQNQQNQNMSYQQPQLGYIFTNSPQSQQAQSQLFMPGGMSDLETKNEFVSKVAAEFASKVAERLYTGGSQQPPHQPSPSPSQEQQQQQQQQAKVQSPPFNPNQTSVPPPQEQQPQQQPQQQPKQQPQQQPQQQPKQQPQQPKSSQVKSSTPPVVPNDRESVSPSVPTSQVNIPPTEAPPPPKVVANNVDPVINTKSEEKPKPQPSSAAPAVTAAPVNKAPRVEPVKAFTPSTAPVPPGKTFASQVKQQPPPSSDASKIVNDKSNSLTETVPVTAAAPPPSITTKEEKSSSPRQPAVVDTKPAKSPSPEVTPPVVTQKPNEPVSMATVVAAGKKPSEPTSAKPEKPAPSVEPTVPVREKTPEVNIVPPSPSEKDKAKESSPLPSTEPEVTGPALPIEILRMDGKAIKLYKTALEEGEEVDHSIRIMIIGHFGVGKTTLARRLLGEPVNIQARDSTNGIDVHIFRCKVSSSDLTWLSLQPDGKSNTARKRLAKVIANRSTGEEVREEDAPTPAVEEILKTTAAKTESSVRAVGSAKQVVDVQGDEMLNSGEQLETQSISKPSDNKEKEKEEEDEDTVSYKEMKALVESGTLDSGEFASVSLWDFAGQYVFYTTHQMFLSPRSVYLLVTDISKHIREVVMEDECYFDSSGPKQCNISEYIDFWLNSIHTCSSDDPCDESTVPPVILVGTHADKLTEPKVTDDGDSRQREENCNRIKLASAYFEAVRNHLREKPTEFHLADADFDIDNTVNDSKLNDLKKKIVEVAQRQPHWGTRIPAKWLPLEAALYGLNEKIVDFVRIEELNDAMSVPISTAEELELFLQFHHQSGNILYFSEGSLKEKVVLDPQWLVNALKSLITANMFYAKNTHVMKKWREFSRNGILRPQLLDAVWHKEKNPSFHDNREHLLALMEKLKLISRPMLWHKVDATPTTKEYHLAPCMLKEKPPDVILSPCHGENCETTSILVFYFKRKFLSPAIFHRLLAACLSKWPLWRQGERDRIFCGCGVFKIDQSHKLTLVFRDFTIQAFVTKFGRLEKSPREETCINVRDFLDNSLTLLTGCIATSSLYKLCIKCPENKSNSVDAIIPVSKLQEEKEVVCSCHDSTDTHVINSVDMLKYWFPCKPDSVTAPLNTGFIPDGNVSCLSTERLRTRPIQRHLGKISQRIGRKYELLVVELGLETHDIEQIQMDKSLDVKTCIFRMLCFWEEKVGMNATFGCLENAMIAVGIDTIKVFEDIDSWDN